MALELLPVNLTEANDYVTSFHRHNKAVHGGKFAIGVTDGEGLVGVAIVGRPIARMLQDGHTAEVSRVCTTDDSPKNVCSMLYAAGWRAWKAMGGNRLITYTLVEEDGTSVKAAGWRVVGETAARKQGKGAWTCNTRARTWNPLYGQLKLRWEAA